MNFAGIEVLRFLCALAVLIWHYQHFPFAGQVDIAQMISIRPAQPFYAPLKYAYDAGFLAVQVFWCISGFIFYWTYAQPIASRRVGLREFAIRRFSRLYPLHVCTLTLVGLLQYLYFSTHGQTFIYGDNSLSSFGAQLLFASNWFMAQPLSFNGPIWSVSVEILVYFGFFAVVRNAAPTPGVALTICFFCWLLNRANPAPIGPLSGNILQCAILFFAGGFSQWLCRQRWGFLLSLLAVAVTAALLASGRIDFDFNVVVVLAVCSVTIFVCLGELKAGSALRRLAFLGNATYSSYLLHFPIQLGTVLIVDAMGYSRTIFLAPLMFVAYVATVIGMSLAVYHLFERPAQRRIRGFAARLGSRRTVLVKSHA
jgi:peptidoglycan/LPS O-acetylase OafA/YrhL